MSEKQEKQGEVATVESKDTTPKIVVNGKGSNTFLQWGIWSTQGLRPTHEDSHIAEGGLIENSLAVFAVFDGHGGSRCSKFLETHFIDIVQSNILKDVEYKKTVTDILRSTTIIRDTFFKIDDEFRGSFESDKNKTSLVNKTSGSTANVLFIENCSSSIELTCANVGDSRCLVYDRGRVFALSKDHKPTDPLEKKRIETHGGFVRRSRLDGHLAMSRAFGDFEDKQVHGVSPQQQPLIVTPDLRPLSLEKVSPHEKSSEANDEQFIVVACDGLFESLDGIEVCEFIKKRLPKQHPRLIAKHLAEHAIKKGSRDNVTAIVIIVSPHEEQNNRAGTFP